MEIIFEIKLKAKESVNGHEVGDTVIIVNSIFDRNNGVAFFPIDKKFDIIYQRQFIGIKDKQGVDLYVGDKVQIAGNVIYEIVWVDINEEHEVYSTFALSNKEQNCLFGIDSFAYPNMIKIGSIHDNN